MDRGDVTSLWPVSQFGLGFGSGSLVTTSQVALNGKLEQTPGDSGAVEGSVGNSHRLGGAVEIKEPPPPSMFSFEDRLHVLLLHWKYSRSRSRSCSRSRSVSRRRRSHSKR